MIVGYSQEMVRSGDGNVLQAAAWALRLPDGRFLSQKNPQFGPDETDPLATKEQFEGIDKFKQLYNATTQQWEVTLPLNFTLAPGNYRLIARESQQDAAGRRLSLANAREFPLLVNRTIDLATLTATEGLIIVGAEAGDRRGWSVSDAGDVNGDGFDDVIIGALGADALGNGKADAGENYVVFGGASMPATIDLANLGSAGFKILGADPNDNSGVSVSSAGGVNGDGFDDILIGARRADAFNNTKAEAGESYVIFGSASPLTKIDLETLGNAGMTILAAAAEDNSGFSVSSAGDVNGEGYNDMLIGAMKANSYAGKSYVIFGGDFTTSIRTTVLANANTGLSANDLFYLGHAMGDVNVGNLGTSKIISSDSTDATAVRQNLSLGANSANVTNIYDVNKDGSVNLLDMSLVRQNAIQRILGIFTAQASLYISATIGPNGMSVPILGGLTVSSRSRRISYNAFIPSELSSSANSGIESRPVAAIERLTVELAIDDESLLDEPESPLDESESTSDDAEEFSDNLASDFDGFFALFGKGLQK